MARIGTNHKNHAATAHNLAVLANSFHAGSDLHGSTNFSTGFLYPPHATRPIEHGPST